MKNLVVISAPSGAGKTTLCKALQKKKGLKFSVSCTTRERRSYEVEGEDYYFITPVEFDHKIKNKEFIEYENVHGFMYGTLKSTVDNAVASGDVILFEVDVKGAFSIKKLYPDRTISIFILPPSVEDLHKRLVKRGTDSHDRIAKRLERLGIEINYKQQFDYTVINDEVEKATYQISSIIQKHNKGVIYVS